MKATMFRECKKGNMGMRGNGEIESVFYWGFFSVYRRTHWRLGSTANGLRALCVLVGRGEV